MNIYRYCYIYSSVYNQMLCFVFLFVLVIFLSNMFCDIYWNDRPLNYLVKVRVHTLARIRLSNPWLISVIFFINFFFNILMCCRELLFCQWSVLFFLLYIRNGDVSFLVMAIARTFFLSEGYKSLRHRV